MSAKADKGKIPSETMGLYSKLLATQPDIEQKGVAMPYTSRNGHMFSFLSESGSMALRLPEPEREEFLRRFKTSLFKAHGTTLKEYVTVPGKLLKNTRELKKYLALSYTYVGTLTPKSPKKGKRRGR